MLSNFKLIVIVVLFWQADSDFHMFSYIFGSRENLFWYVLWGTRLFFVCLFVRCVILLCPCWYIAGGRENYSLLND